MPNIEESEQQMVFDSNDNADSPWKRIKSVSIERERSMCVVDTWEK